MSDFYPLQHNRLNRDIGLLKKLEIKHKQLEDRAINSKKASQLTHFKAHPSLIRSDSDTTASCTPRIIKTNFSSSTTNLVYGKSQNKPVLSQGTSAFFQRTYAYRETKQKARLFHRRLHEKLSVIDSTPSERSDFSALTDSDRMFQKGISESYQAVRIKSGSSDSSAGSFSLDSDDDCSNSCLKSSEIKGKSKTDVNRPENNYSAASKTTNGGERRSAGSRISSQQSICLRGLPISVFERKFKIVVTKCLQNIASIRDTLSKGITPPDGEEDESRRIVRVKEFFNRFSRNYLYPLARQVKGLGVINQTNPLFVNQKLLSTYQIIHNAVQAYQTHLPTSLGDCTYNQLKTLMNNIVEVCGIHRNHLNKGEEDYVVEFIDTFKINAELTIQKIDECLTVVPPTTTDRTLKSDQSKISLTKYGNKNGKQKNVDKCGGKKGKLDKRLSMYTVTASFRKDAPWKRAVESLATKKFDVKSKYKTATYKHRPPLQKDPDLISIPKFKSLFPFKPSSVLVPTRLNSPLNEDHIKTMVEAEQSGETHLEKEEWENMEKRSDEIKLEVSSNKEEILMKLLQFTLKSHNQGYSEDDKSQISEIITLIKKESNEEFLKKVLDGLSDKDDIEKNMEKKQQLTLEIVKSQCSFSDGGVSSREKTERKEPKITITGDKNARLICITDDNSVVEPLEDEAAVGNQKPNTENVEPAKMVTKTSSETQTDTKESNITSKGTQKGKQPAVIKISRLKKSERSLKPLEKQQAVDAIQYKLDFYRYCKNNPMYKRSTTCQPWVLMSKISEGLLNECLLTVAREIEINDIVEKVYQSELQL